MSTNCYWMAVFFGRVRLRSAMVATVAVESITLSSIRPQYDAPLLDGWRATSHSTSPVDKSASCSADTSNSWLWNIWLCMICGQACAIISFFVYVKFLTILLYEDSFIRYPQKVITVIFNFERLSQHILPRHVRPEGFSWFSLISTNK